jgi:ABC-type dipeptide/oligopeptide/nickel transport system permease component
MRPALFFAKRPPPMAHETGALWRYACRRMTHAVPLILGVVVMNFTLIHLAPGDPILALIGEFQASPEYVQSVRQQFGLDRPLPVQLGLYLWNLLQGDFGFSFALKQPVLEVILDRVPATLLLMGVAILYATVCGALCGVLSSRRQYSIADNAFTLVALIGYSMPVFWLGQILLILFGLQYPIFPAQGMESLRESYTGIARGLDILHHLVLPAFTLGLGYLAVDLRFTRSSMIEVMSQDYIRTARAKGLSERAVFYKHALRNALIPLVTITGLNFGFLLAGAVLTETVYAWPGLGRLMYDSIYARDYPVLMGMFVVISVMVIVVNFVTDIAYSVLDPRIRIR